MPSVPTTPATLSLLRAMQTLILTNVLIGGTSPFAALSSADATRYGATNAIYIGEPKDFRDGYLPQCHLVAEEEAVMLVGAQGRASDELQIRLTVVVDFTDWWAAEQSILALRDTIWPVLMAHLRGGAGTGTSFVALDLAEATLQHQNGFATMQVAGVWYRTWTCHLLARQVWAASGGLVP